MIALLAPVDLERILGMKEKTFAWPHWMPWPTSIRKETPAAVLKHYPDMTPKLRTRTIDMLLARRSWALALLQSVDEGSYRARISPVEQLRINLGS